MASRGRIGLTDGNFVGSLANVARYLGRKAEALGVEIYPGFAAVEMLYGDKGEVVGVASGDMGVGRNARITEGSKRGMEPTAKSGAGAQGARGPPPQGQARRRPSAGRRSGAVPGGGGASACQELSEVGRSGGLQGARPGKALTRFG